MTTNSPFLSRAAIKELAPSVFAEAPHKSRSERYGYVPSSQIVTSLFKEDYVCVAASQSKVRKGNADKANFTKHMLRFRSRKHAEAERVVGGLIPEVVLINSHDGSSSFILQAGLFRLVCANGLVIQSADHGSFRIHHTGDIAQRVIEASDAIMEQAPKIMAVTKEWDAIKVNRRQQLALANKALVLRFNENSPLTADQVLVPKRNEDEAPTLWRTFNIIQEHLSQGGLAGRTANGRNTVVRSIKSVNNTLNFNRGLWALADAMARKAG